MPESKWINIVLFDVKTTLPGAFHSLKYCTYAVIYRAISAHQFNRRLDLRRIVVGQIADVALGKTEHEESRRCN